MFAAEKIHYVSLLTAIALFLKPLWLKNPNCKPIYRELPLVLNSSRMLPQEIVRSDIGAVRIQFNMKFANSNHLIQNAYTLVTWQVEWYLLTYRYLSLRKWRKNNFKNIPDISSCSYYVYYYVHCFRHLSIFFCIEDFCIL